jgi:hypothetical protein
MPYVPAELLNDVTCQARLDVEAAEQCLNVDEIGLDLDHKQDI